MRAKQGIKGILSSMSKWTRTRASLCAVNQSAPTKTNPNHADTTAVCSQARRRRVQPGQARKGSPKARLMIEPALNPSRLAAAAAQQRAAAPAIVASIACNRIIAFLPGWKAGASNTTKLPGDGGD